MATVKCARGDKIPRGHFCQKTLLHEGIELHEDTFAQADNFTRRHFCTGWFFSIFYLLILILRKKYSLFYCYPTLVYNFYFRAGCPKVCQVATLGTMTDIQGATSSKRVTGINGKKAIGPWGNNFLKLTLDILKLQMNKKKKREKKGS